MSMVHDSKQALSINLIRPITKVLMITYTGSKDDFKLKSLKIINFIISLQQKVKKNFKL